MGYKIRTTTVDDAEAISPLLTSLGYPTHTGALRTRIPHILNNPDARLLVVVSGSFEVVGLLSVHSIAQLGLGGGVARTEFLVVPESCQRSGVGRLLESYAEEISREHGCDPMVSHPSTC